MPGARSSSTSSSSVGCSGPGSWSSSASGPFSRTPCGWSLSVTISDAWATGSPSKKSKPRTTWPRSVPGYPHGYQGRPLGSGHGAPAGPLYGLPSAQARHRWLGGGPGTAPPEGSPLYLSEDQIKHYSPGKYLRNSWPWEEYTRTLKEDSVLPTTLRNIPGRYFCSLQQGLAWILCGHPPRAQVP